MTWWALGRVDELMRYKAATWEAMKRSGLKMVFCGAESGSTDTLQRMNKGGTASAELTLELAARMKAYGIVPEFSFVVGNPPDPEADLRADAVVHPPHQADQRRDRDHPLRLFAGADGRHLLRRGAARGLRVSRDARRVGQRSLAGVLAAARSAHAVVAGEVRRRVRDFETVLNAYYPTVTDTRLTPARRRLLRAASAWRYHAKAYARPFELNLLQRVFHYQRPETTGF